MPPDTVPAVSVVCATYRRPEAVARLLSCLERQDLGAPFEVLVVDDGSDLATITALREAIRVSSLSARLLLQQRNTGAATARNTGWRVARATVVAFTDDDCQPVPGWLSGGLAALRPGVDVVVGRVAPNPGQTHLSGPWSRSLSVEDIRFFQTANAFYRKADLERVGGFDPRLARGGEDTDLGLRVLGSSGSAAFAPEALVHHDVRVVGVFRLAREAATRWIDLPLVVRKHPELRSSLLHRRLFWKRTHPPTMAALGGLALAPWSTWALLLLVPWAVVRRRLSWRTIPGTFLIDAAEVAACVRGTVKHRSVLL